MAERWPMNRFRVCLSLVRDGMDPITAFNKSHTKSYGKYTRTRAPPDSAGSSCE